MKAIYLSAHGGPEVLQFGELPVPQPGPGEALVRLHAAALNRLDLWVRQGWPGIRLKYPHIPGADGAGEIAALGPGAAGWQVGERVVINANIGCGECEFCIQGLENQCRSWQLVGETRAGTYAQYTCVPAHNLKRVPEGFNLAEAAAAALVFHTAWHSLVDRARLRPGESVLVVGASGGVNTAAIQIARFAGATVYVVGAGPEKLALAASLGAHFLIDRTQEEDWPRAIYRLTEKRGVDVVVDNVGSTFPLSFRAARKGGRILTVGNTGGPLVQIDNRYMFAKHLSLLGSTMGTRRDFDQVMDLVFAGKLRPLLGERFPLAEAQRAHTLLESGAQSGKITLEIP